MCSKVSPKNSSILEFNPHFSPGTEMSFQQSSRANNHIINAYLKYAVTQSIWLAAIINITLLCAAAKIRTSYSQCVEAEKVDK